MKPCPCGSGRTYAECCRPWHQGTPAPTAETLMRSRYSAYALGLAEYIQATTHLDSPHREADTQAWLADIRRFSSGSAFERLVVHAAEEGPGRATVEFEAFLTQGGRPVVLHEKSTFYKVGGRWLYHSGVRPRR